jgi:hypothetical protein
MRISAYARATNPKYANFAPIDWSQLAGQLGTKARGALSTSGGAAKLGAGIGAGVGAINYLGSDDKSIGNLAGQVAGGAALGGAAGYGGSRLKNAWQARKMANQPILAPAASTMPQPQAPVPTSNGQPIQTAAPKQQVQLPAAQPVSRPQPIQNGVITPPAPASQQTIDTTAITVPNASGQTQSGASAPQNPVNTVATGAVERENQKMRGIDKSGRGNASVPVEKTDGSVRGAVTSSQLSLQERARKLLLERRGVKSVNELSAYDRDTYLSLSRNTSPFANFKVRRYKGFVY